MGVLNRFKAKLAARQEKKRQIYENARPARLAALHKEKEILTKQKQERTLVNQVKALKAEARKEKMKPLTQTLSGFKTLAKETRTLANKAQAKQKLVKGKSLADQRKNNMFGDVGKKNLFEVKDWRDKK